MICLREICRVHARLKVCFVHYKGDQTPLLPSLSSEEADTCDTTPLQNSLFLSEEADTGEKKHLTGPMGRGKIELKKIENPTNRQVTFSKSRTGLLKKAKELAILCDAQIVVIIFSGSGKMCKHSFPFHLSIANIFDRYLKAPSTRFEEMDIQQKIIHEMTKMKDERNMLRIIMRQYTGEDLASLNLQDLGNLEQQIEFSQDKVRLRKVTSSKSTEELFDQQLRYMRHRVRSIPCSSILNLCSNLSSSELGCVHEKQPGELRQQTQAAEMANPKLFPWWDVGGSSQLHGQDAESSMTALQLSSQLHEFNLQPLQPNLQDASLQGYLRRLW
ncbi:MADS-box protein ZMM17-like [Phragmites australis]|uniref:MADS-box protein ZMM17-like n=1 Tax=Phragmites australis TaxID=29695 RepID=UPI002D770F5D|nr:MADS-box protein ZMM17-like [Phragmites australis]